MVLKKRSPDCLPSCQEAEAPMLADPCNTTSPLPYVAGYVSTGLPDASRVIAVISIASFAVRFSVLFGKTGKMDGDF